MPDDTGPQIKPTTQRGFMAYWLSLLQVYCVVLTPTLLLNSLEQILRFIERNLIHIHALGLSIKHMNSFPAIDRILRLSFFSML